MPETTEKPTQKIYYDPISVAKRTKQIAYFVGQHDKPSILEHIFKNSDAKQCVIITKSKRSADELSDYLELKEIKATAIHGNHRTQQIEDATNGFNSSEISILITTDMILQSLELENIQLMISYDLPNEPKHYLTRIGYLKEIGDSIAFVSPEDDKLLNAIEFTMKAEIEDGIVEGFTPTPHSHNYENKNSTKDKKKKPRHRKRKARKDTKTKEETQ